MEITDDEMRTLIAEGAKSIEYISRPGWDCLLETSKVEIVKRIDRLRQLAEALSEPTDGPA